MRRHHSIQILQNENRRQKSHSEKINFLFGPSTIINLKFFCVIICMIWQNFPQIQQILADIHQRDLLKSKSFPADYALINKGLLLFLGLYHGLLPIRVDQTGHLSNEIAYSYSVEVFSAIFALMPFLCSLNR